ncbi:hypothetical protein VTI74DRAFT_926 [Chaetomium olivicolor]
MSTPTPGKPALPGQGKTPSQPHHGAAATPPVSTPFSAAQAAFSPHGPRSSPQQVKKSPATSVTVGRNSVPVNFESPSAAAALGSLDMAAGLDLGLQNLANLGRASDDEKSKRLDNVLAILNRNKGLVSEAGLERLVKKLELEFFWENSMGSDDKKTLIVAGSALELLIEFSNNVVQSVSLNFPESAEIVNKHAKAAGEILFNDLRLREGQSPLTKSLGSFASNFERLAVLDKLSVNPGLNLYEAVAGIYESLTRLHAWELQKTREDPSLAGRSDDYLENVVLCTKSGKPTMNEAGRMGMALNYWKEKRCWKTDPDMTKWVAENEQTWSIIIGCAPLREIGPNPVRISDKWIGPNVEKMALPDELHAAGPIIDWLEPESTFLPSGDQTKADPMRPDAAMLGARLPEVVFHATFDPPVHIPVSLWQQIQELGCMSHDAQPKQLTSFDDLVFPLPQGKALTETPRVVTCTKKTPFCGPGETTVSTLKTHAYTLYVSKPVLSRTLSEMTFSHPQQLITILPYLRQYIFLARLLEASFSGKPDPAVVAQSADGKPSPTTTTSSTSTTTIKPTSTTITKTNTTNAADYHSLMSLSNPPTPNTTQDSEPPLPIDISLSLLPTPRLQIRFPLTPDKTANVALEIRENGRVAVESQNVLGEHNAAAASGRPRQAEDVARLLEAMEDVGKWAEFVRSRWV